MKCRMRALSREHNRYRSSGSRVSDELGILQGVRWHLSPAKNISLGVSYFPERKVTLLTSKPETMPAIEKKS